MKCSEYLWERTKLDDELPKDVRPFEVQGRMLEILGMENVVSDTTGEPMLERDINSIMGRNEEKLLIAFHNNDVAEFTRICIEQLKKDDEYEASKIK